MAIWYNIDYVWLYFSGRDANKDFMYKIPHKDQQFVQIERQDTVRNIGVILNEKLFF